MFNNDIIFKLINPSFGVIDSIDQLNQYKLARTTIIYEGLAVFSLKLVIQIKSNFIIIISFVSLKVLLKSRQKS